MLLVSVAVLSGLTLVLTWRLAPQIEALAELRERAASCRPSHSATSSAPRVEVESTPPPPSAPLGSGTYVAAGVDVAPLMRLRLERVRNGAPAGTVRFGAAEVLSPRAVHVLSLWAPWCVACKEVLPDLRELFARRGSSWGDAVRFLPVQVLDPTAPEDAIRTWGALMPPSAVQLADRSLADSFVAVLRDESRRLYQGTLPVTLALDCNRRVRWARIGVPGPAEMKELEEWLDTFRAELKDGDSRCRQVWCGNGRCENGEVGRCEEDCGTPSEATIPNERPVSGPIEVAVVAPSDIAPAPTGPGKHSASRPRLRAPPPARVAIPRDVASPSGSARRHRPSRRCPAAATAAATRTRTARRAAATAAAKQAYSAAAARANATSAYRRRSGRTELGPPVLEFPSRHSSNRARGRAGARLDEASTRGR
ncbi:TlpA family protein disulfide reductase [Nannocystis pusilla]|uniref:TlpA family protein disulfide reductase n=1 Tax=Nannocystis pusilla TaxID=889268 RepID=UPI003B7BBB46